MLQMDLLADQILLTLRVKRKPWNAEDKSNEKGEETFTELIIHRKLRRFRIHIILLTQSKIVANVRLFA